MESEQIEKVCDKHGKYFSQVAQIYNARFETSCPTCETEFSSGSSTSERYRINRYEAGIRLGIGKRFLDKNFDDYIATLKEQEAALGAAKGILSSFSAIRETGTAILFFGNSGTGKTMLATVIAVSLLIDEVKVVYTTVQKAIRGIRATFNGRGDEQTQIDKLSNCEFLILEEIGVQLGTQYEISILHEIIDERYKELRPTLLTSNLDLDGIREYLGDRVMRRLSDSNGIIVPFTWEKFSGKVK